MRRKLKSGTGYPLTTSPRHPNRVNRLSEKPIDMRNPKRVRFVDGERVHDSPERCEATESESPRSDAPKTSEFAYFRKVKNGAVHGHSRSLQKENENLKRPKINNLIGETSTDFGTFKTSRKDPKSSVSGERAGPSDNNIFLSPRVSTYDEPEQRKRIDKGEAKSSLLFDNVTPVGQSSLSSLPHEASENSENEYNEKGIFWAKRHRLCQLAAQTLFSEEAEKVHPRGFDFVTALMSRLFPKDKENNNNSSKEDADNTSKSLILHESNNLDTGLYLSNKEDWDNDIPKVTSGRSNGILLPERDTFISVFPFHTYETESRAQDLHDQQHPKNHVNKTSPTQNDFSLCLPFERYDKTSNSFRFEVLDEFSSITDRQRDHRPLLEQDPSEWGKEDILGLSAFNHGDTENVHTRFPTSRSVGQKRPFTSFSNHFPEFDLFTKNGSTGSLTQDLLSAPKCIILGEETNDENLLCDQNIILGLSGFYDDETENVHTGFPTSWSVGQKRLCSSFSNCSPEFDSLMKNSSSGCFAQDLPSAPKRIIMRKETNDEKLLCDQNIILGSSVFYDDDAENVHTGIPPSLSVGQKRLCSSFSNCLPKFDSLPKNSSTSWLTQDLKYIAPKCFVLGEETNDKNLLCDQNIIFSDRDQHCPKSDYRQKCLSAPDFSLKDYYPSIFQYPRNDCRLYSPGKPFTRLSGMNNNHSLLPSSHHQSSFGTFTNRPLLLDHVSCDWPDRELYFGDEDNELEYR